MTMLALSPITTPELSDNAERLLAYFRSESMHWVVLHHACTQGVAGLNEAEIVSAVHELEVADRVERAAYGPLIFIR